MFENCEYVGAIWILKFLAVTTPCILCCIKAIVYVIVNISFSIQCALCKYLMCKKFSKEIFCRQKI